MKTSVVCRVLRCVLVAGLSFVCAVSTSRAQGTPAPAVPAPKVISLTGTLELGSDIRVGVAGLEAWAATHPAGKLLPVVNGRTLRGSFPTEVHAANGNLIYHLAITPDSRSTWIDLLGAPDGVHKAVEFSVGLEGDTPFATVISGERLAPLVVIEPVYGWVSLAVVAVTLVAFIVLARRTGIIRDGSAVSASGRRAPYNLGRTQMAFWFFLSFTSYIVIWLITDAIDTITPSLLGLMGISAGTALGEVLIDANKDATGVAKQQAATAEQQALAQGVAELQTQLAAVNANPTPTVNDATARDSLNRQLLEQRTRLNQLAQVKAPTGPAGPGESLGFWRDILSDGGGYSFHRFQIVAWTIAMGGVFLSTVYNSLTMPEFSATMLGLMGMSSGTYIGFKFPEQR